MRALLVVLFSTVLFGFAQADPVKIAVVSTADTRDLSTLVTTELATHPEMTLIERDDLAKVGDEAALQQLAGKDAVALGKLVGADGLVFIAKQSDNIQVRLTSVRLGYALFDETEPPAAQLPTLAKSIAHRVTGYLNQLHLTAAQAIPISVLNLRANFPTPEATALERRLTLLLESQLAAQPRYVVLERRHAWSLGFERSLNPAPGALIPGSYVVDGTFDLATSGAQNLTVHLRLRSPDGKSAESQIVGASSDPTGGVTNLVTAIAKTTGAGPAAWQPEQEAREYLTEGVWGWQHKASDEAIEALDSAELLGEKAPELHIARIAVLCDMIKNGLTVENGRTIVSGQPDPASADAKTDLMLRAIDELVLWRHMEHATDTTIPELRNALHGWVDPPNLVVTLASNLIVQLNRDSPADADKVRLGLRKYTQYDPLHGTLGNSWGSYDMSLREEQENEWCISLEEELAAYRMDLSDPGHWMPFAFLHGGTNFCHRFLKTPEEQSAAFANFVESLKDIPGARFNYLMIRCSSPDPTKADAAFAEYLAALWDIRDELVKSAGYDARWGVGRELSKDILERNSKAGLPLLRYILQRRTIFNHAEPFLVLLWHPNSWSDADAPGVWKDFQDYKQRVTAVWKQHDSNIEALTEYVGPYETDFLKRFPTLAAPAPAPAANPLVATRFWYPWRGDASMPHDYFYFGLMDFDAHGLWLTGFHAGEGHTALFRITLPDFTAQTVPIPQDHSPEELRATPDALFMTWETHGHDGTPAIPHQIARYDLATSQWATHDLPDYSSCKIYTVGKDLYFYMQMFAAHSGSPDSALQRYDWNADTLTLLSSTRRHPGQNQFDDRRMLMQMEVFAGPGGKPCASSDRGIVYIQDKPGDWPPVFDSTFWDHAIIANGLTLVQNQYGEATLIDPAANDVQHLMAGSTPFVRHSPPPGGTAVRELSPWAAQTIWDAPANEHVWYGKMAFAPGRLFILEPPAQKGGAFDLLVYRKDGGRAPVHVPLEFHLSDSDRVAVSETPAHAPTGWKIDWLEHPDETTYPQGDVQIFGTAQGLILKPANIGMWFVPYQDIDAYLKNIPPGK